jgi:methionyl-tRNA synthetase
VYNLKPVKLRGELSQGMLLLAEDENDVLSFIQTEDDFKTGLKIR